MSDYDSKFRQYKALDRATIIAAASEFSLTIVTTDIQNNLDFLSEFKNIYPEKTTDTKQFSLLILFFAIRRQHRLVGFEEDIRMIPHLKNIYLALKKDKKLCAAQLDIYKWFTHLK